MRITTTKTMTFTMVPFRTRGAELNDSTAFASFAFSSNIRNHLLTRLRMLFSASVILYVLPIILQLNFVLERIMTDANLPRHEQGHDRAAAKK